MTSVFLPPPAPPRFFISGLVPINIAGTNTTATLNITPGQAVDRTGVTYLSTTANTAWAVSNGNAINGFEGGTTLPNSSTIHFWICTGTSGTGIFASVSTTPTLPSGYNLYYRRVCSLTTDAAGALRPGFVVQFGQSYALNYNTPVLDIAVTNLGTSAITYTLSTPDNLVTQVLYRANLDSPQAAHLRSGGVTNYAIPAYGVSFTAVAGWDLNGGVGGTSNVAGVARDGLLTTSTGMAISAKATAINQALYFITLGYVDPRSVF